MQPPPSFLRFVNKDRFIGSNSFIYVVQYMCISFRSKKRDLCHSFSLQPRNRERNMMDGSSYYE
jgi:hypothetical protein